MGTAETKKKGFTFQRDKLLLLAMVLSFIIGALLFSIEGIRVYEWRLADVWARLNYPQKVSDKVAVVGIDDNLFQMGDYDWPLEKDVYAHLIMFLEEMGAKVIAFDLDFSHNFQKCGASDSLFLGMVGSSDDIVIGYGFLVDSLRRSNDNSGLLRNDTLLAQVDSRFSIGQGKIYIDPLKVSSALIPYLGLSQTMRQAGFVNRAKPMPDGVDRYMPLLMEQDSLLFSSIALSVVKQFTKEKATYNNRKHTVSIPGKTWKVSPKCNMMVNFTDSIPVYPMSEIMLSFQHYLMGQTPELGKKELSGRAIFVGYMGTTAGDLGVNPVSDKRDAGTNYNGKTPMVMLHAYSANTMLEDRDFTALGRGGSLLLSVILSLFIFILFKRIPQNGLNIIIPILLISVIALGYLLYRSYIFLPIIEPIVSASLLSVAGIFINYYDSNREYRYISSLFRTYISPELIEEMAKNHTVPKLGGEQIEGTAFFTDIEKFSTFSEIFTPEELIHILNIYFSEMTEILKKNRGTLDKFIGDAIVAIFGAPYFYEDNAEQACMAAWNMQQALAKLRTKWRNDPELASKVGNMQMRIGINSGPFIVGHLGCEDRMNYTMIGDTVNLAARLESGAKQYGIYTVVGESTYESAKNRFLFRCLDRIVVVGRKEPVSIYELIAPIEEVTPAMETCCNSYASALQLYTVGDFKRALTAFIEAEKCELITGEKNPSTVMRHRCEELIETTPEQWDGVYTMRSK